MLISFILCSEYSLTSGSRLATLSGGGCAPAPCRRPRSAPPKPPSRPRGSSAPWRAWPPSPGLPRNGTSPLDLLPVRGRPSRSLARGRACGTVLAPLLPEILGAERAGETDRGPAVRDHQAQSRARGSLYVEQVVEDDGDLEVVVSCGGDRGSVRPAEAPHRLHDRRVRREIPLLEEAPRGEGHLQRVV